jgi:hypothetical protein
MKKYVKTGKTRYDKAKNINLAVQAEPDVSTKYVHDLR